MNQPTIDAWGELAKGLVFEVRRDVTNPARQIQTNTANALIRRGLAYTYRTQTKGRVNLLAISSQGQVRWFRGTVDMADDDA